MQPKTLTRSALEYFLGQLDNAGPDYITIYAAPGSFPGYPIEMLLTAGTPGGHVKEALSTESMLPVARRYGTGGVVFWNQRKNGSVILPPFLVVEDQVFHGKAETMPLRSLLDKERLLGIVMVTWGSYAVGVVKNDKLVDCKVGTGYIHKRHRKGGRSEKRFARRTEEQKKDFLRKVANRVEEKFNAYPVEQIFFGGNRLIIKPLAEECPYLRAETHQLSRRFLNARYADKETLLRSIEQVNTSVVFEYWGVPTEA